MRVSDAFVIYRHQMIRAVLGTSPAILAKEADTTALDRIAARLVEAEEALTLLRAKGYGARGQTLVEVVKDLPPAPPAAAPTPGELHDIWSSG